MFEIVLLGKEFQMTAIFSEQFEDSDYLFTAFQVEKPALIEKSHVYPKIVPNSLEYRLNGCYYSVYFKFFLTFYHFICLKAAFQIIPSDLSFSSLLFP